MSFTVTVQDDQRAEEMLAKIKAAMTPEAIDPVIEAVAVETFAHLVEATPKKWFGSVRAGWRLEKGDHYESSPGHFTNLGSRLIINRNKVMHFLEEGTADGGTGFIFPTNKKFLFIPLRREAAGGWHEGLKYGVDYILKLKVRGITPRHIVADERKLADERLKVAAKDHLDKALAA